MTGTRLKRQARSVRVRATLFCAALLCAALIALLGAACQDGERGEASGDGGGRSGTQSTIRPDSVALRYVYQESASWVHEATSDDDLTMDAALVGASEGVVTSHETSKERRTVAVEQVHADGSATVAMTYEQVESTVDGAAQDLSGEAPRTTTITIDQTGRVISVAGFEEDEATSGSFDSAGFSQLFDYIDASYDSTAVHYPEAGAAKIGETWSSSYAIPLPGMGKELTVTTEATLVSVSTEDGRAVAVIEHASSMPVDVTFDLSDYFRSLLEGTSYAVDLESLVVKMIMTGEIGYEATSKVETTTGRLISAQGEAAMAVEFTYSEAPEELFPPDQRGPFSMKATGARTIIEVR